MTSESAKDAVLFRPTRTLLEVFCRDHEIY